MPAFSAPRKLGRFARLVERARVAMEISALPALLGVASVEGDLAEARRLLALGARDDPKRQASSLAEAAKRGDADMVEALLAERASDPGWRDEDGLSALDHAAAQAHKPPCDPGDARCLRLLIPSQAHAAPEWGRSALTRAAAAGRSACVRELLDSLDPSTPAGKLATSHGSDGWTALLRAAHSGSAACVAALLPRSDPLARQGNGLDALMIAADVGNASIVEMLRPLVEPRTILLSANGRHWSALMLAANKDHAERSVGSDLHGSLRCVQILMEGATPEQTLAAQETASDATFGWIAGWIQSQAELAELAEASPSKGSQPRTTTTPSRRI